MSDYIDTDSPGVTFESVEYYHCRVCGTDRPAPEAPSNYADCQCSGRMELRSTIEPVYSAPIDEGDTDYWSEEWDEEEVDA
jgi:hypothetical protein